MRKAESLPPADGAKFVADSRLIKATPTVCCSSTQQRRPVQTHAGIGSARYTTLCVRGGQADWADKVDGKLSLPYRAQTSSWLKIPSALGGLGPME